MNKKQQAIALRIIFAATLVTIATGTVFYHYVEGFSWIDAYYFSVITLTTVGYGDLVPHTDIGKLFTTLYIFVGVGIITGFITTLSKRAAQKRIEKQSKSQEI